MEQEVFSTISSEDENKITDFLCHLKWICLTINSQLMKKQIKMKVINIKKGCKFDLITDKILKNWIETNNFYIKRNIAYNQFPGTWKVIQIIIIIKMLIKSQNMSLLIGLNMLLMLFKVFEKMYIKIIKLLIGERKVILEYQFEF